MGKLATLIDNCFPTPTPRIFPPVSCSLLPVRDRVEGVSQTLDPVDTGPTAYLGTNSPDLGDVTGARGTRFH